MNVTLVGWTPPATTITEAAATATPLPSVSRKATPLPSVYFWPVQLAVVLTSPAGADGAAPDLGGSGILPDLSVRGAQVNVVADDDHAVGAGGAIVVTVRAGQAGVERRPVQAVGGGEDPADGGRPLATVFRPVLMNIVPSGVVMIVWTSWEPKK